MPANTRKPSKTLAFYKTLHRHFGPQGWWPVTPAHSAEPVYKPKKPLTGLSEEERFEICLGAILTQNTTWSNVTRVLVQLKREGALGFESLLRVALRDLELYFRSSGYFRQKSARVRNFMGEVRRSAGSFAAFFDAPLPALRERLLALNGIGPETADSMLLYAGGKPTFVVDAYTRRVATRWGLLKGNESYDEIQALFMKSLPRSASLYGEYHALIVRLAKELCHKREPDCRPCPLRRICRTGQKREKSK